VGIESPTPRRESVVDLLRGLVILLMAIDHTRDFFQPRGLNPTDLDSTTVPFFLTRWITHFCAPLFVFLAGVGAGLSQKRSGSVDATRSFLIRRGVWLMFLECTWVTFSWHFGPGSVHLGVLWGIGGSMVLLGCLVRFSPPLLGLGGLTLTLLLGLWPGPDTGVLRFFFLPGSFSLGGWGVSSVYVIVPWFAVMACGYALAESLADPGRHRRVGLLGLVLIVAFALLRGFNGYGDPAPWAAHPRGSLISALSFLDTSKYPPSLDFQLMTIGPALLAVPLLARWRGALAEIVQRFGRVALFFYLLHLPLVHGLGILHARLRWSESHIPSTEPLSLPTVYGAWILLIALLWWPCLRYDEAKRGANRRDWMKWI